MRRLPRKTIVALAAAGFMFTPGAVATAHHYTGNWNCRAVTANDITFFANSTGDSQTHPYKLTKGDIFKSYGVVNGRFKATSWSYFRGSDGYTTSDSRWVTQIDDRYCQ